MSYIKPHMTEALSNHELVKRSDNHYVMSKPGTGIYRVDIGFIGDRIVLTGDLTIGTPNGCVSASGYSLSWFCETMDEGYLCSKFLQKEWQWVCAKEQLAEWLQYPDCYLKDQQHAELIHDLMNGDWSRPFGARTCELFSHALADLSWDYIADGVPGYDWPRSDAGWLCAVNQRFAELYHKQKSEK